MEQLLIKIIKWVIIKYLQDYHLSKNPKKRKVKNNEQ